MKINIPKHLINLRRDMNSRGITSPIERSIYKMYAWMMSGTKRYRLANLMQKSLRLVSKDGYVKWCPPPGGGWTKVRDLPSPAKKTFRQWWGKNR